MDKRHRSPNAYDGLENIETEGGYLVVNEVLEVFSVPDRNKGWDIWI